MWETTHKVGGKLLKIAGVVIFCGVLFPKHLGVFVIEPLVLVPTYSLVYSYREYGKESRA